MILLIDSQKGRDITVAEIPGAYLHASFPPGKKVILKLQGVFVYIMCSVNPDYNKDVIIKINKNGGNVKSLYICILRALYGCFELAVLWHNLYSSTPSNSGFKINHYDRCMANKLINRE